MPTGSCLLALPTLFPVPSLMEPRRTSQARILTQRAEPENR